MTALLFGCKKTAEYRDVVFFTGTEASPEVRLVVDGSAEMGLSVTSSKKAEEPVNIEIKIDTVVLQAHNAENRKLYQLPPADSYRLEASKTVIEPGKNVSDAVKFSLLSTSKFKEGVTYCVPVSMVSVSNDGVSILNASKTVYIVIVNSVITKAVDLAQTRYFTVPGFKDNADLSNLGAVTMECRVYMKSFHPENANPGIMSVMGVEEDFLLRFGDISAKKNQLQIAGGGLSLTSRTEFATEKWYHIAAVFDGKTETIYVDGRLDASIDRSKVVNLAWDYMEGFHIGFSERGRLMNGHVSEARVWNRALSPAELQNNVCYVDPTSEGLVAYWRLNGVEGGKALDLTGHGYDAVASGAINMVDGVRCPELSK